jgi:hypothetical protein
MTENIADKTLPLRDEAPSPTESVKDEGKDWRLLIVANRLPITIKKQPDVSFLNWAMCPYCIGRVSLQSLRGRIGYGIVRIEEDNVFFMDWLDG